MKNISQRYIRQIMEQEDAHMAAMHRIVADALHEESLINQRLCESDPGVESFGNRLADKVAQFGGSWRFIITFGAILLGWIALNTFVLTQRPFDPYPYILLNLVLSCVAALQAPVIMMSQNRQEAKDRRRAENDYMVNLKSEIEIRHLHEKLDLSMVEQHRQMLDIQQQQLEMLERLQQELAALKAAK